MPCPDREPITPYDFIPSPKCQDRMRAHILEGMRFEERLRKIDNLYKKETDAYLEATQRMFEENGWPYPPEESQEEVLARVYTNAPKLGPEKIDKLMEKMCLPSIDFPEVSSPK